ncbi:uncharacterized protein TNCV_2693151 [Trichonephila clavipes]|uniref:Tc3 transposase DNA binding domain-containing protein n=1 Tax=Trichonephila clavipes TaxID=2585209 RepID=A0A8X6VZ83_TRICX|nr:uncharacterized protein TNCV_2693151 [Trichonephila clavipes]
MRQFYQRCNLEFEECVIIRISAYTGNMNSHELVAGVSWARVLLPLKSCRVDEADVVVRKEWCQLRCPPRHSTEAQNYEEDFGKRNRPGKRARRHFSQLSEFERGLIIGMKTTGWSMRHVAGQVNRSECAVRNCWEQKTREGTHARKTLSGATRKTTRRND